MLNMNILNQLNHTTNPVIAFVMIWIYAFMLFVGFFGIGLILEIILGKIKQLRHK